MIEFLEIFRIDFLFKFGKQNNVFLIDKIFSILKNKILYFPISWQKKLRAKIFKE